MKFETPPSFFADEPPAPSFDGANMVLNFEESAPHGAASCIAPKVALIRAFRKEPCDQRVVHLHDLDGYVIEAGAPL